MVHTLVLLVGSLFLFLGSLHVYWAFGGQRFGMGAVPHSEAGEPVFQPGKLATLVVAAGLFLFAAIVAGNTGLFGEAVPNAVIRIGTGVIAVIFTARTIGDFRYVGLFKRLRTTVFARKDTYIYTPLCCVIAAACWGILL